MKNTYAGAGVDIDAGTKAKNLIGRLARQTHGPQVLSEIGFFGGLFEFSGYKNPVLVTSVDGVGTKLKIAAAIGKHDTVGIDIVNHCVNDIFAGGASPLFFMDYIAAGKLKPEQVAEIVSGITTACKENGCALLGGETAEMPGLYHGEDYDLAGFIVGVVEKDVIVMGKSITPRDAIIGLPSNGLHTNGYSLARHVLGESAKEMAVHYDELGKTVGEALLMPHRSYYPILKPLLSHIKGMAHITGGGLTDNVPRILPAGVTTRFNSKQWQVPPIFSLIQSKGNIDRDEMFHVFNMGIGMVVVCAPEHADNIIKSAPEAMIIGEITTGGEATVQID
ncbi:phosphoribosylformylglycinamidine cyclo-ligase [Chloroflexota bacterium]